MNVYICSAARTAIGTYGGTSAMYTPPSLAPLLQRQLSSVQALTRKQSTRFCSVRYCRAA